MFYRPENGHGLPRNPFSALIAPRPIAWISTRGADGQDNLAPYSFFNAVAYTPPQVMFSTTSRKADRKIGKDSLANIEETGVFCVNLVSKPLLAEMNQSSGNWPREVDEFELTGLERSPCETITCARVTAAIASLECRLLQIHPLAGVDNVMAIGVVTGVHIADHTLVDGKFDAKLAQLVARMGYRDYTAIGDSFELPRPGEE